MFTNEIVIDMGYAQTVIAMRGKGVIFKEPSIVAVAHQGKKLKFYGSGLEAKRYLRTRDRDPLAVAVHPVRGGAIEDYDAAVYMLKDFLRRALPKRGLFSPRPEVIATIACGTSVVERKNYENLLTEVGLKSPILMETPIAVSANLSSDYNLIATLGASISDVAIVGPSGIITGCSVTMCGTAIDEKICAYIAENYRLGISLLRAEELRVKIGSVASDQMMSSDISGKNLVDDSPYQVEITSEEIAPMITSVLSSFATVIESVSMMCPEKYIPDVYNAGITLCGGLAAGDGVAEFLYNRLKIKVLVPKAPDETIALGALAFFDDRDKMYRML